MIDIIIAMTKNGGIGLNNKLSWKCKEELKLFKEKTMDNILIMGRKTVENLPYLPGREIWCITHDKNLDTSSYKNNVTIYTDLTKLENDMNKTDRSLFCAGGKTIYELFNSTWKNKINKWHVSIMNDDYKCDTFLSLNIPINTKIITKKKYNDFTHYVFNVIKNPQDMTQEKEYLNILKKVYNNGKIRQGRNGTIKSLFCQNLHFDLTKSFPLLTTKRMFWRGIVEELLFFLRGETNSKKLEDKNINIWKGNTRRKFLDTHGFQNRLEGIMGPMYGFQWRNFNGDYDEKTGRIYPDKNANHGIDQLKNVINKIKNDPHSRRILMTTYNPAQNNQGVLYPCHSLIIQFYVDGNYLDMYCFNRSSDLFLGLPFNISSTALLLTIIAKTTRKIARHFHLTLGDAHIYQQHYTAVQEQLKRIPIVLPTLSITKELCNTNDIEQLTLHDFDLQNYQCHSSIKAPMIA